MPAGEAAAQVDDWLSIFQLIAVSPSAIRTALADGVFVALSSEVLPEFREFERLSTTVINAYAGPRMAHYLDGFAARDQSATPRTSDSGH